MKCQKCGANNANTQRIIDHLTQSEITGLRTELQSAQLQLSQLSQTRALINEIKPCPIPAYLTCSPYTRGGRRRIPPCRHHQGMRLSTTVRSNISASSTINRANAKGW